MNNSDDPSSTNVDMPSTNVDEQFSEPLSALDATPISSTTPQSSTGFMPTTVSTVVLPQVSGMATAATSLGALQSASPSGILNSNSNSSNYDNKNNSDQSSVGDRTTTIVLATVLSVVGCLLVGGTVCLFLRCYRRRTSLFTRGITPIGDDEIETWKGRRTEKGHDLDADPPPPSPPSPPSPPPTQQEQQQQQQQQQIQQRRTEDMGHQKSESTNSIRKPPSVIVYARKSEEFSPRSPTLPDYPFSKLSLDGGKRSFERELPMSPIQARAPNAREGLTDEAIPGDEPFVASPKRRGSRLSKGPRYPHGHSHARSKSSRSSSSLHRLGDRVFSYEPDDHRPSNELYSGHSRCPSSPPQQQQQQQPPRLSLSEDWPAGPGGLSPRPFCIRAEDIGRAIG